jgi:hypothetical protein
VSSAGSSVSGREESTPEIGLLDFLVVQKICGITVQHHVTVFQHIAPPGKFQGQARILLHQQDGGPLGLVDLLLLTFTVQAPVFIINFSTKFSVGVCGKMGVMSIDKDVG